MILNFLQKAILKLGPLSLTYNPHTSEIFLAKGLWHFPRRSHMRCAEVFLAEHSSAAFISQFD